MKTEMAPRIFEHTSMHVRVQFSPDGKHLLCFTDGWEQDPGKKATCLVIDTESGAEIARLNSHSFNEISFSPDGSSFVNSSRTGVSIWDCSSWSQKSEFKPQASDEKFPDYNSVSWSPDGMSLAVSSEKSLADSDAVIINAHDGTTIRKFSKSPDDFELESIGFSRDGTRLMALGYVYDFIGRAYVWDCSSESLIDVLDLESRFEMPEENRIALHASSGLVASAGRDLLSWQFLATSKKWEESDQSTAFGELGVDSHIAESGTRFCASGMDTTTEETGENQCAILITDLAGDEKKWSFPGKAFCSAISADGSVAALLSADVEDFLDDEADSYKLTLIAGNSVSEHVTAARKTNLLFHCPVNAAFSPNGRQLAVAHLNHVELWTIQ